MANMARQRKFLHSILTHRPATCPPHMINTSSQSDKLDPDKGDKFNNSDTASEDGPLSDGKAAFMYTFHVIQADCEPFSQLLSCLASF